MVCGNAGIIKSKTKRVIATAKTPSTNDSKRFLSLISSYARDLRSLSCSIRDLRLSSDDFSDIYYNINLKIFIIL